MMLFLKITPVVQVVHILQKQRLNLVRDHVLLI